MDRHAHWFCSQPFSEKFLTSPWLLFWSCTRKQHVWAWPFLGVAVLHMQHSNKGAKAFLPGNRNSWLYALYFPKRGLILFSCATTPSSVTSPLQRPAFIFVTCLWPGRIQPTWNLKVWWRFCGRKQHPLQVLHGSSVPETCSLSLLRTPTSATRLWPKRLQRGHSLPTGASHYGHDQTSCTCATGWWNQVRGRGWRLTGCRLFLTRRTPRTASPSRKPNDVSGVALL